MRILVIEDQPAIARFMANGLSEEGHAVTTVADLAHARERLRDGWDVLIVDRMLPDGDGLDLVRAMRRDGDTTPVMCVTARDQVPERVAGLHAGADDYLVKPFAFEELLARVLALHRRAGGDGALRVGDLVVDRQAHRVWRGDEELLLTAQEFRLLVVLAQSAGTVLTRANLLARVWDVHHDPGTNVVDVYVRYLRQKLERPDQPRLLHTVRGVGYVLDTAQRPGE